MKQIIVIGGGAAGLMAAVAAAGEGAAVTVLDGNEKPGKKILATGNGRCNLTNIVQEKSCYRGSDPDRAWEVLQQFPLSDTLRFFSKIGIYTKNKNGWMYPNSEQAVAVLDCLLMEAKHRRVKLKTRQQILDIRYDGSFWEVVTESWSYHADACILACGSPASVVEGSSDFGMQFARKHQIPTADFQPALVGLRGSDSFYSAWAGVRVSAKVTLLLEDIAWKSEFGEVQLTDYGISGIPVFQLSRYAIRAVMEGSRVNIQLDFLPDFTEEELLAYMEQRIRECPHKNLSEQLIGLLPAKLIPVLVKKDEELLAVVHKIKYFTVEVRGASSLGQAQVCSGGILLSACDSHLQSIAYPGLYFAGEVLDVDGACGGYNLQWAWSSGAVAGRAAAKENI